MANTFSPDLSTTISKVRLKIGDTGDGVGGFAAPLYEAELPDETITALLTVAGDNVVRAAALCARALAAKYAKMVDVDVDNQLTKASQRFKQYTTLAERLEREDLAGTATEISTGSGYDGGPLVFGVDDCRGPLDPPLAGRCC